MTASMTLGVVHDFISLLIDIFQDGVALFILALVIANVRNCSCQVPKVRALDVFLGSIFQLHGQSQMVPYIVELLHDDAALVRLAALRTLMQTVSESLVVF